MVDNFNIEYLHKKYIFFILKYLPSLFLMFIPALEMHHKFPISLKNMLLFRQM